MQDKLTKLAKGRPCMIRLIGVCSGDTSTTVLAHYRMAGLSGVGMKPPSFIGAWSCSDCHHAVDRRAHLELEYDFVRLAHAEGVLRTQNELIKEGLEKTPGAIDSHEQ